METVAHTNAAHMYGEINIRARRLTKTQCVLVSTHNKKTHGVYTAWTNAPCVVWTCTVHTAREKSTHSHPSTQKRRLLTSITKIFWFLLLFYYKSLWNKSPPRTVAATAYIQRLCTPRTEYPNKNTQDSQLCTSTNQREKKCIKYEQMKDQEEKM